MRISQRRYLLLAIAVILAAALGAIAAARSPSDETSAVTSTPAHCTAEYASLSGAAHALAEAHAGATICLAAGSYDETLSLTARHARYVTLRAAPGAHVQLGTVKIAGNHIALADLWIHGEVALEEGTSFVTIDHDDISNEGGNGGEGIVFDTSNCTAPNAPTWSGCEPHAPISDITISRNHIHGIGEGGSEDAIHLDNWRNVRIVDNELDDIVESGNHTDCLQSVYGGENLTFTRNYEHDNDCQGIFIKDGDAKNVTFTDNLFLRDQLGSYADFSQLWNVHNLIVQRNTIWDGKGLVLVADQSSLAPTARVDHNVIDIFTIERPVGTPYTVIDARNIFGQSPWSFRSSHTDRAAARPRFVDAARGDYRLARNPHHVGIDWSPASEHYGPPS